MPGTTARATTTWTTCSRRRPWPTSLDATFAIVERCLDTWTIESLADVLRRPEWDDTWVHTRGSVIQRVFAHDIYHVSEASLALGAAGIPAIDLWP